MSQQQYVVVVLVRAQDGEMKRPSRDLGSRRTLLAIGIDKPLSSNLFG